MINKSSICIITKELMTLRVRLLSAQLSHDTEILSNMDPYCFLQLGSQRYRSKTKKQAGKKPVWNEKFQFSSADNLLKITVMDQDTFSDDLVGEGTVDIRQFRNNPNEVQHVVQLYYQGKTAGKVMLAISGGQGQNAWGQNNTNIGNTWGQTNMNQGSINPNISPPYTQPAYNQPPYNQPTFNQPFVQPNYAGYQQPNQFGGQGWASQGSIPNNSPWGDLNKNNGWGDFNPYAQSGSSPNIPPPNFNPLSLIGGIIGPNPPTSNQSGFSGNPYAGNPYR